MSAKTVDVLAAMDAMIHDFSVDIRVPIAEIVSGPCGDLIRARAAVAELIEAARGHYIQQAGCSHRTCARMKNAGPNTTLCESCAQWGQFRTALARVGGAP